MANPGAEEPQGAGGVAAIQLVLAILEELAKQETVGVTELANRLGTTKPRVFRHLRTLVDQGYADKFLEPQLQHWRLDAAARKAGQALTLRVHAGYDHSYYFISTFMEDHLLHHAQALHG